MSFSPTRVLILLKKDIRFHAKGFGMLSLGFFVVCALIMFVSTEEYCQTDSYVDITEVIYYSILIYGGFMFSASLFRRAKHSSKRKKKLKCQATTVETWLSKWLLTVPIYTAVSYLVIFISYSVLAHLIENMWSECRFLPLLDSLTIDSESSKIIKLYVIFQSLAFLWGTFNTSSILKGLCIGIIVSILFSLYVLMPVRFVEYDLFSDYFINRLLLVVPLLWVLAYVKLKGTS